MLGTQTGPDLLQFTDRRFTAPPLVRWQQQTKQKLFLVSVQRSLSTLTGET